MEYNGVKDTNVILNDIYNGLSEDEYGVTLYPPRVDSDGDDELYVTKAGMCYRVTVTPHPHPKD